jgi:hypothetical protein
MLAYREAKIKKFEVDPRELWSIRIVGILDTLRMCDMDRKGTGPPQCH